MICEMCGCTDERACIDLRTGEPCHWTEPNLCSCCDWLGGPGLAIRTWPLPEYSPEREARDLGPYVRGEDAELDRRMDACWQDVVLPLIDQAFTKTGVAEDGWYCGDPTCPVCKEEDRVPAEVRRE